MKNISKIRLFVLLPVVALSSCASSSGQPISYSDEPSLILTLDENWPDEPLNETTTLDFYSINDFHGSVAYNPSSNEIGLTRLATYLKQKEEENRNSVFLAAGDIWQGSADSNITRGRLLVDAMNLLDFEAMAIGNHEFDWTDEVILDNKQRADFPFLGANIMDKRTGKRSDLALPYTIINREGVKIGIIGTIGSTLETSILASAVANYDFIPAGEIVKKASIYLKDLGADMIVLLNHNPTIESTVLPYVDLIFNAHTHEYEKTIREGVPSLQALSNGKAVAHARFEFTKSAHQLTLKTYDVDRDLINRNLQEDGEISELYNTYLEEEINGIKNEHIGIAERNFAKDNLGALAVRSMHEAVKDDYDIAASFHNRGGVRDTVLAGEVTYGDIYKVFPFDNYITVVEVTGSQLKWWLSQDDYVYGANPFTNTLTGNIPIADGKKYRIATINYLSEKTYANESDYPHNIKNEVYLDLFVRDTIAAYWRTHITLDPSDYIA